MVLLGLYIELTGLFTVVVGLLSTGAAVVFKFSGESILGVVITDTSMGGVSAPVPLLLPLLIPLVSVSVMSNG